MPPTSNDPRLIKAEIEGLQSAIGDLLRDARTALVQVEDHQVRLALNSLTSSVGLLSALVTMALIPYLRELDERIAENVEKAEAEKIRQNRRLRPKGAR